MRHHIALVDFLIKPSDLGLHNAGCAKGIDRFGLGWLPNLDGGFPIGFAAVLGIRSGFFIGCPPNLPCQYVRNFLIVYSTDVSSLPKRFPSPLLPFQGLLSLFRSFSRFELVGQIVASIFVEFAFFGEVVLSLRIVQDDGDGWDNLLAMEDMVGGLRLRSSVLNID